MIKGDILTGDNHTVAYVTPPFLPRALKEKCRTQKRFEFTFLDSYLCPGNILRSACARLKIKGGRKSWEGTLLRRQGRRGMFIHSHLIYYHAFKKWLQDEAPEKVVIIYPFENQPWEKMLCRAVEESGKKIRLNPTL